MQTFFRRIRKALIDSSSVRKYILYAIGEIALVVIGILIAIQLNNINNKRIALEKGDTLLAKLQKELEKDIEYLDSLNNVYQTWTSETEYILDSVLSGKIKKLTDLNQYTVGRTSMNFLNISEITFNEIITAGNSASFRGDSLLTLIKEYYQLADRELQKLNSDNVIFFEWILDNIHLNLWHRLYQNRNLEYEDWNWLQNPNSAKYKELESRTSYFQIAIQENQKVIQTLKEESTFLLLEIDRYSNR